MKSKITVVPCLLLLMVSLGTEGMAVRGIGVELRCRCIETESRRMGKLIESVELFPRSAHCKDVEIIATLKGTGQHICLNTSAPWVKKVIERILVKS